MLDTDLLILPLSLLFNLFYWYKRMTESGDNFPVYAAALPYFDKTYDEPGVRESVSTFSVLSSVSYLIN